MKKQFKGKVETDDRWNRFYNECGHDDIGQECAVLIGGEDVVDELHELDGKKECVVLVNGAEIARGKLHTELAWGYSEYTPMDGDEIEISLGVGKKRFDLIGHLEALNGEEIELVVEEVDKVNPTLPASAT